MYKSVSASSDGPDLESEDLITRCIDGDGRAWRELIEAHRSILLRVLVRALHALDPSAVGDLEQDLYARLVANDREVLRPLRGARPEAVRAFLCRMAMNLARDHRRRMNVRRVVQSVDLAGSHAESVADPAVDLESEFLDAERRALVFRTAERVVKGSNAARDLMIFRAHWLEGLSAAEISSMGIGLTPKGVETLLSRLTIRVRDALRAKNEDAA